MTARAVLYKKLLKQSAKELRCRTSDERAKNYAVLKLAREVISSKLVNGKDIDPSALRWLSEELEKYAPAAVAPNVQLTIQPVTLCAKCRAEVEAEPPSPLPPDRAPVAAEGSDNVTPQATPNPKPSFERADNVVELVPDKLKARDFHRGRES
jgi:hypothetical protein